MNIRQAETAGLFLTNGSRMSERIRSMDWSKTALGDMKQWSYSLRTTVSMVLNYQNPMYLAWGNEFIQIYNDAYQPLLGANQLTALGLSTKETYKESWDVISKVFHAVLEGKSVDTNDKLVVIEKNGKDEEAYFKWSYSPVFDENGVVAGVLATAVENTNHIVNERRFNLFSALSSFLNVDASLESLCGLSVRVLKQNPKDIPFAVLYMYSENSRKYEHITDIGLLQFSLNESLIFENSRLPFLHEIPLKMLFPKIDFEEPRNFIRIPEKCFVIPVVRPDQRKKFGILILGINPLIPFNNSYKEFFKLVGDQFSSIVLHKLTDSILWKQNTESREKKYRQLIQCLPAAVYTCDKDGTINYYNDLAAKLWGYTPDINENIVKFCACHRVWMPDGTFIPPDKTPMAIALEYGRSFRNIEALFERPDGSKFYASVNIDPLYDDENNICGAINIFQDISDLKLAEMALRENETLYKQILEALPVAVYTTNAEGNISLYNKAAIDLWGREPEKETDRWCCWQKIFNNEGKEISIEESPMATSLIFKKEVHGEEIIIERPDGSRKVISPHPKLIYNSFGRLIGAVNTLMDLTDFKEAESAMRESEERFRIVADTAPVMIWMSDPEGKCEFLNCEWSKFTGILLEEGLGDGWKKAVHPEDLKKASALFHKAIKNRTDYSTQLRLKRHDGEYRWMMDYAVPRIDENGDLLGFVGSTLDIHEQHSAKEDLEERVLARTEDLINMNVELQQQKEFVEAIIDSSVDMIGVYDKETRFMAFNNKCELILGIKKEEVIGKKFLEIFPQAKGTQSYKDLLIALDGYPVKNSNFKPNQIPEKHFETYLIPLRDSRNEVYAVLVTAHDVTAIAETAARLKQMNEELVKTNNELEQFAYVSSHDLQEPLRKIKTFSDLVLNNIQNPEFEAGKFLEKINASANRMSVLIKDLLNYSRITKTDDQFVDTDLNEVLNNVTNDFEVLVKQKNAVINAEYLPKIKAIPIQMNQLFHNLISNSLKFSEKPPVIHITAREMDEKDLSVHPQLSDNNRYIQLTFRDNGIGFDMEYAHKIFTIFQRLNDSRTYSGTGIGLAICKKIVENHKGIIIAKSELGKGSEFNLCFPYH